jgi:hypothetical protein
MLILIFWFVFKLSLLFFDGRLPDASDKRFGCSEKQVVVKRSKFNPRVCIE